MSVDSPVQSLLQYYISLYLHNGPPIPGTLVNRLVQFELSPVQCAYNKYVHPVKNECGTSDSLRSLLMHENFIEPYSDEHILATLLTKSF